MAVIINPTIMSIIPASTDFLLCSKSHLLQLTRVLARCSVA
jgi:hypothetical protein